MEDKCVIRKEVLQWVHESLSLSKQFDFSGNLDELHCSLAGRKFQKECKRTCLNDHLFFIHGNRCVPNLETQIEINRLIKQ